jgi:MFS family permease
MQLGIIGASPFAYTIVCLFSGRLSDRLGRRNVAAIGCALASAGYFLIPHTRSLLTLLCSVVWISFSMALIWPPVQAWLSEQPDRRSLSSSVGIFNVSWTLGIAVGPIVSSRLVTLDPQLYLPLYAAGGLALFSMLVMYTIKINGRPGEELAPLDAPRTGVATFMYMAWVLNFGSWFASSCVRALLPKLTRASGIEDVTLGWLVSSVMIGQALMFVILQCTSRWQYRAWPLLLCSCISAAGILFVRFGAGPRVWALGLPLVGIGCGMTYYCSLFYTLTAAAKGRGRATGLHEAVLGSGLVFGPLLGGASVKLSDGNLKTPYLLSACVTVITVIVAIGIYLRAARRGRIPHRAPSAPPALEE